jgi:hypothetical protein
MKRYSIYFLAHGGYFENDVFDNGSFTLPENIRLITYSPPTKLLDSIVAKNVIEQLKENPLDIPNNFIFYSAYTDGEIYRSEINPIIRKGGTSITNMKLQFTNDIPGFDMNIFVLENNTQKVMNMEGFGHVDLKDTDLETVIGIIKKYISSKSPEMDDDEIIDGPKEGRTDGFNNCENEGYTEGDMLGLSLGDDDEITVGPEDGIAVGDVVGSDD